MRVTLVIRHTIFIGRTIFQIELKEDKNKKNDNGKGQDL